MSLLRLPEHHKIKNKKCYNLIYQTTNYKIKKNKISVCYYITNLVS